MSYDKRAECSTAFRAYRHHFKLSLPDVASAANVRMLTAWKIEQGLPIREADALAVCAALYHRTGVPFTALIPIIPTEILRLTQAPQTRNEP